MNNTLVTVDEHGSKRWYLNDKLHREDGAAIEYPNGYKQWYQCGKLHRIDGPAIEYANGSKVWMHHGRFHRIDGAAIEGGGDGSKAWYVNGTLCLTIEYWAAKALQYENKLITQQDVDVKVMQVMQQDLFA